jgi:iron(III) transport system permease protein
MATVTAQPALGSRRWKLSEIENVPATILLGVVGFVVLYPVLQVCIQSVLVSSPGEAARFGLDGWTSLFTEQGMRQAAVNTIGLSLARETIALPLAILLAWLIARTDLPGRHFFEFAFWLSFFLPTLTVTLSWILLLDPEYGLINQITSKIGLPAFSI